MNETVNTLLARRSIRKYRHEQIKDEELDCILKCGQYAMTARGEQPWFFVAVQDDETKKQLSEMNAAVMGSHMDPYYGAPTVIIVLADSKAKEPVADASLAIGNMANAAASLGIGSCWINREKEMFETPDGKALLEKWNISKDYIGVGALILGYPEGDAPKAAPRKEGNILIIK